MSRSQRLLALMEILRRHRYPLTGAFLAQQLGISVRSLYRDIATLQQQGASIEGEAGLGYVLRPGFTLPPLMFSEDEIEALVLGSRWVATRGDARLASAAENALAKINAVLPGALRESSESATLLVGPGTMLNLLNSAQIDLNLLRRAIRNEKKLLIAYQDASGSPSKRMIWPFALGFFDAVQVLIGWCELRQSFRHFRTDRIQSAELSTEHYPKKRQALLKEWRASENIAEQ